MKVLKFIGNFLFLLCIISVPLSFWVSGVIGEVSIFGIAGIVRYIWIMWLFIPIGVLSFLIGVLLKRHQLKYKKNCIVAIIVVSLLLLFGSYTFVFSDVINYSNATIEAVEQKVQTRLPDDVKIATQHLKEYDVSNAKILNDIEKQSFEAYIENNDTWTRQLSPKLHNSLPYMIQVELYCFDYFLFYNATTDTFFQYPDETGNYSCVFIAYDCEVGRLLLVNNFILSIY